MLYFLSGAMHDLIVNSAKDAPETLLRRVWLQEIRSRVCISALDLGITYRHGVPVVTLIAESREVGYPHGSFTYNDN